MPAQPDSTLDVLCSSPRLPSPLPTIAVIAGASLDFTTVATLIRGTLTDTVGAQVTTLSRKPAGSAAAVSAHAITTDAAVYGEFDVTVTTVNGTRNYRVVSFPSTHLSTRVNQDPSGTSTPARFLTLDQLRRWADAASLAQITTAVEVTTPSIAALYQTGNPACNAALSQ